MNRPRLISRRHALVAGLTSVGGLLLPGCSRRLPPTYGHVLRMGDNLTYAAHRTLLPGQSLAREYSRADITSLPAIGTTNPADSRQAYFSADQGPAYERLQHGGFADWRLTVEGHVTRPRSWSLAELKRLPSRTQITRHQCEEGWSSIAEWTGVPLHQVLDAAGMRPSARFVQFHAFDDIADGIDLLDALHPQTILAYGLNGRELSVPHGAPLRLRVERQLGYKSVKYLRRIVVTEEFDDLGRLGPLQNGWSWYAGI